MKRVILLSCLGLFLVLTGFFWQRVEAADFQFGYLSEDSDVSELALINLSLSNQLSPKYLIEGSVGLADLIADDNSSRWQVGFYRKINYRSDFDYYLGLSFTSLTDKQSSYQIGGELVKTQTYVNLRGINKRDDYTIYSQLSYSPIGGYQYLNNDSRALTGYEIMLGMEMNLTGNLAAYTEGRIGKDYYQNIDVSHRNFSIGLGWSL